MLESEKFNFLGDALLAIDLKWRRILPIIILPILMVGNVGRAEERTEPEIFQLYSCIQPNVDFWFKIYTQYSSDKGVIHDKNRMERIYGVIPLMDPYRAGGRKINKKRIKAAKKKYKAILAKLMKGQAPVGAVEKRVADQFGADAKATDFQSAMRNLRCQTGQKDRFREGLIRSGAYIDEIKQIFRDAGLPEDLAYLPHVESSFNPKAYSKFGAAGMWQFTRSTGKRFLKVGYTIDERRDPILSSHAAAKLLRQNFRKLKTWPLAITAYNHGVTGIRRAVRKKGSYERIFKEYRSRIFKFASRNFYSEFLAARLAAKNYRQYFGEIKLDPPYKTRELKLDGYVSLPEVARHLALDLAELEKLNPALRRPVFRGLKYVPRGYRLRLPDKSGRDWDAVIAQLPQELYRHRQKRSSIYTVRSGDTAGKIAKSHGVKLNELIAVNNLDRRATIYVKQKLRIPLPEEKPIRVARVEHTPKKKHIAVPPQPVAKPLPSDNWQRSADQDVLVAKHSNENLNAISPGDRKSQATRRHTADEAAEIQLAKNIPQANQMAAFLLALGIVVAEYQQPDSALTTTAEKISAELSPKQQIPNRPSPHQAGLMDLSVSELQAHPEIMQGHFAVDRVTGQHGKSVGFIRVEAEETLGHYAEWLNVAAGAIRRLNGFSYGRPLNLNQTIKIPLDRSTKEEFEEKRFEFHQKMAEDFFANYRVEKVMTYSIKRGDNIWTLSRQEFEVPFWLLKRYNTGVDFGALMPFQKLLIPIVERNA